VENIEKEIYRHIADINNSIEVNEFVINERQELIVREVYKKVKSGMDHWNEKEIVSIYLNEALKEIETLSGKIGSEEILNTIFDKFCIGK
jgi:tRNA U34 5-carboxymethylaminomethyl modifying GTPase MnmE/TrmE